MENKIKMVKDRVDIIKVAQYFGLSLNKANKCNCIWHKEKTASLSFSKSKQIFHCFGCGIGGDVITLVSKLLNINAYESAKQINNIFSLCVDFEKPTSNFEMNKYKQIQQAKENFKQWENKTFQLLCDYLHSLKGIEKYKEREKIEYFIDIFIYGTEEDWLWFKKTEERWCEKIEQRVRTTTT